MNELSQPIEARLYALLRLKNVLKGEESEMHLLQGNCESLQLYESKPWR